MSDHGRLAAGDPLVADSGSAGSSGGHLYGAGYGARYPVTAEEEAAFLQERVVPTTLHSRKRLEQQYGKSAFVATPYLGADGQQRQYLSFKHHSTPEHQQKLARWETEIEHNLTPRQPFKELYFEESVGKVFEQLQSTLLSKHRDYGPGNISESPGGPLNGLRVRIHDKVARINNLLDSGTDPQHESLEDSFLDLANYAAIAVLVLRKQWPQ